MVGKQNDLVLVEIDDGAAVVEIDSGFSGGG